MTWAEEYWREVIIKTLKESEENGYKINSLEFIDLLHNRHIAFFREQKAYILSLRYIPDILTELRNIISDDPEKGGDGKAGAVTNPEPLKTSGVNPKPPSKGEVK